MVMSENSFAYIAAVSMLVLWVLALFSFLLFAFRKYTFGNWRIGENPYQGETLGLPRGTIRAIITLSLLFIFISLEVLNLHVPGFEATRESLIVSVQMILTSRWSMFSVSWSFVLTGSVEP